MDVTNCALSSSGRITAVLGPTNTGKTWHAIDRMTGFDSGVIGFPLRLLARENYDRVVKLKGVSKVALITGEEKIIPSRSRYFLCTVEAMPVEREFDFLGVDEIQLCGDPERGHVFTDRLLRARGKAETMFMGSDTAKPLLQTLVPGIEFISRERFSDLRYAGFKKLSRLPPRSAVVAFSVNDVYNLAELIRRHRGGTAVVLGALSPRTRSAQVEMYQSGEVDFLVATDAIGMGLNMDINHAALASIRKYDGSKPRYLDKSEIAQIAGRAGRYTKDGTFGITGPVKELDPQDIEAIETHNFDALKAFYWRNSALDFSSPKALLKSLEANSGRKNLIRGRPSDDYVALAHLCKNDDIKAQATNPEAVRLLWKTCQIPDFRKTLSEYHHKMVGEIFMHLMKGPMPEDWVAGHVKKLDRLDGDVDTLMARIAHVRTWTYIAHHGEWLNRAGEWQEKTRAIEDRLSDTLHEALTRRFVDQRAAVLMRSLEEGREMLAGVRSSGEVIVEGQPVGHLQGFRFITDKRAKDTELKAVMSAARNALKQEIIRRKQAMLNAEAKQFSLNDDGRIFYQADATNPTPGEPLAQVRKGESILRPDIDLHESELLTGKDSEAVKDHLKGWLHNHIDTVLEPLKALENTEEVSAPVRGICYQVHEALGIIPRHVVEPLIEELDAEGRAALRARKVRLGPILVFIPALNKPAAVRLRGLLWSLWNDKPLPAPAPPDGAVSIAVQRRETDPRFYRAVGYPVFGPRAIRIDMLDRVINAVYESAEKGVFKAEHKMAEWLGCSIPDLYDILQAMGHRKIHDPAREKVTPESHSHEGGSPESSDTGCPAEPGMTEEKQETPAEQPKPELATFRLKKGKASDRPKPRKRRDKEAAENKPNAKEKKKLKPDSTPRVMEAKPKIAPEDSPFAVLQQLKEK
jgi:ATP-dependent RNA helicase SUPV3L1/SUV3